MHSPAIRAADDHVLSRPRGRCRALRAERRATIALALLAAFALAAVVARIAFAPGASALAL